MQAQRGATERVSYDETYTPTLQLPRSRLGGSVHELGVRSLCLITFFSSVVGSLAFPAQPHVREPKSRIFNSGMVYITSIPTIKPNIYTHQNSEGDPSTLTKTVI